MAGILDSKSRVIDFALTPAGRAQLASGRIRFVKATVSDRSSFYERDASGATDATERIYFETYANKYDKVTVETDDSGQLIPFETADYKVTATGIYTPSGDQVVDAGIFASLGSDLSGTSADNFAKLRVLITDDPDDRQKTQFLVDGTSFYFIPSMPDFVRKPERHIDEIESLLFDKRLAKKPNFKFLPPVNADGSRLGYYSDVRQKFEDVPDEDVAISNLLSAGKGTKYQSFVTRFRETSPSNTLNVQVFETGRTSGIRKLDMIDYGRVKFRGGEAHVVFAGRIIRNSFKFPVFVNAMTLVFV